MYKKILLVTSILIISGCAGKLGNLDKGVSEEDRKLISSPKDEILYIYKGRLRITKHGFYPNYDIEIPKKPLDTDGFYENYYSTPIASYSRLKKFNLKKFIDDIHDNKLQDLKPRLIPFIRKYSNRYYRGYGSSINHFLPNEIMLLTSNDISSSRKEKILKDALDRINIRFESCKKNGGSMGYDGICKPNSSEPYIEHRQIHPNAHHNGL